MICGCLKPSHQGLMTHTLELWWFWSQTERSLTRPHCHPFLIPSPHAEKINHDETTDGPPSEEFHHRGFYSDMRQRWRRTAKKYTELFKIYGARNVSFGKKKKKTEKETALRGVHLYLMSDSVVSSRAATFQGRQDISSSSPATSTPPPRPKPHLPPPPS